MCILVNVMWCVDVGEVNVKVGGGVEIGRTVVLTFGGGWSDGEHG